MVCPGMDESGTSLGAWWHIEAYCCDAVEVAEVWSLLHFAAAAVELEEAFVADAAESSSCPQHLHPPFVGADSEAGAAEASHLAAAAAGHQPLGPNPAVGLTAEPELGSEALGVVFHQTLGY